MHNGLYIWPRQRPQALRLTTEFARLTAFFFFLFRLLLLLPLPLSLVLKRYQSASRQHPWLIQRFLRTTILALDRVDPSE